MQDEPGNYGAGFLGLRCLTKSWMLVLQSSFQWLLSDGLLILYMYYIYIYIDINSLTIAKPWPRNGSYAGIWWNRLRLMIQKSYMLLGTGYSHWTHHFSHVGPKDSSLLNCVKLWCDVSKFDPFCIPFFLVCFQILSNMQVTSNSIHTSHNQYMFSPCKTIVVLEFLTKIHHWTQWYHGV